MVQFGQFFHAGYSMFKELKFGGQWFSLVKSDAMFWVSRSEFSLIPITTIHVMILGRALEWNVYSAGASVYDCLNLVFRRRNDKPWQKKRWRWANRKADERDWWIPWSFLSQTNHPNLPGYFLMWPVGFGNHIRVREGAKIHFLPDIQIRMYTKGGYWKCVCADRFLQTWTYWLMEEMWNWSKARHDPTGDPKKCNKNWNTPRNGSQWMRFIVYICDVHSNSLLGEMHHFY